MVIAFFLCFGAMCVVIWIAFQHDQKGRKETFGLISTIPDFSPTHTLTTPTKALSIDLVSRQLALSVRLAGGGRVLNIPFESICSFAIERDGNVSTTRKSGFATFSGDAFPRSLDMYIALTNCEIDSIRMPLFRLIGNKPSGSTKYLYDAAKRDAQLWQGVIERVINERSAPRSAVREALESTAGNATSLTNQLAALHDLHKAGALTDAEFSAGKTRLLDLQA